MRILPSFTLFLSLYFDSLVPAVAFTGKEMMEEFSRDERILYVTGLVDMARYQAHLDDDAERSQCILDWFHSSELKPMTQIEQVFSRYDDKQAQPLVVVLINRACGKT